MTRPAYESVPLTLSIDLNNPRWAYTMDRATDREALRAKFGRHVDLCAAVSSGLLEKNHAQRLQACEQAERDGKLSEVERLAAKANEQAWKADDSVPHVWKATRRMWDGDGWQFEALMGVFASCAGAVSYVEQWVKDNPTVQRANYGSAETSPTFGIGEQPDIDDGGPDIVIEKERLWP